MPNPAPKPSTDPIALIAEVNAGRAPALLQRKFDAMAQDPFVFLRATAMLGHRAIDLPGLPEAPLGWVCGDLHLQNFGCFRGNNRLVYFDLNDFDEAARLPVCIDLLRFLGSIHTAAPSLHVARADAKALVTAALDAYAQALERGKAYWLERETATGPIGKLLGQVMMRKRRKLLDARTRIAATRRRIAIDGVRYLGVAPADPIRPQLAQGLTVLAHSYHDASFFKPLDYAFRVAGMGSLGIPRYVALVRGKGSPNRNALIDFKWAAPSSAAAAWPQYPQPDWSSEAARVVAVQDVCQAASPAYLCALRLGGQAYVVRELQPVEDRVNLAHLGGSAGPLCATLQEMARLSAYAQLRSAGRRGAAGVDALIDFGARIRSRPRPWLEAARAIAAANAQAFATFRQAWKGRDPRLLTLCEGAGASAGAVAPERSAAAANPKKAAPKGKTQAARKAAPSAKAARAPTPLTRSSS